MGILGFIGGLFSSNQVVETATKIIDKVAGTDWTAKERADWIIQYQNATKHQSPARRFIAITVTLFWVVISITWLVSVILGLGFGFDGCVSIANQMKIYSADAIKEPFNYVIMFYFAIGALNKIK